MSALGVPSDGNGLLAAAAPSSSATPASGDLAPTAEPIVRAEDTVELSSAATAPPETAGDGAAAS